MKKWLLLVPLLLGLSLFCSGQAVTTLDQNCNVWGAAPTTTQCGGTTSAASGTQLFFPDIRGTITNQFEVVVQGTAPGSLTVTVVGCMRGGTCSATLASSSGTASQILAPASASLNVYDKYGVTVSWTGGDTTTRFVVNRTGTVAKLSGSGTGGIAAVGWHRQGTVIPPLNSADQFSTQETTVISDTATGKVVPVTAQILTNATSPVLGATFSCGFLAEGICYAESMDGINWFRFATNPLTNLSNHSGSCVLVNGSNLEMYTGTPSNGAGGETQIDQFTSTLANPTAWTLAHSAVLTLGTAGAWDSLHFGNCGVRIEGTTRYMLYEAIKTAGSWSVGLATSTDGGVTWTKNAGNPLITGRGGPRSFLKVNGTYYVWVHSAPSGTGIPSDIYEYTAPAPAGPWTALNNGNCILCRQTADEGANSTTGQAADPSAFEFNGATYMTYEGNPNGNVTGFHVKLAVAYAPIAIVAPTAPVVVEPTAWDTTNPGSYLGQPGKFGAGLSTQFFNFAPNPTDIGNIGANCHVQTDNATPVRDNSALNAGGFCLQMNTSTQSNSNFILARPINTSGTLSNVYLAAEDTSGNTFDTVGSYFGTNVSTNTDPTHNLTCSTSSATYTFTGRYAHHPVCMCSDETTAGGVKTTYTGTTSVTYTCPGASDVIDCMCIGRDLNP